MSSNLSLAVSKLEQERPTSSSSPSTSGGASVSPANLRNSSNSPSTSASAGQLTFPRNHAAGDLNGSASEERHLIGSISGQIHQSPSSSSDGAHPLTKLLHAAYLRSPTLFSPGTLPDASIISFPPRFLDISDAEILELVKELELTEKQQQISTAEDNTSGLNFEGENDNALNAVFGCCCYAGEASRVPSVPISENERRAIRQRGTFTISSRQSRHAHSSTYSSSSSTPLTFPHQNDPNQQAKIYKTSGLLPMGIDSNQTVFLQNLAYSLRFVTLYSPKFLKKASLCCQKILSTLGMLVDLLFGVWGASHVLVDEVNARLEFERGKFLVAELKIGRHLQPTLSLLSSHILTQVSRARSEHIMLLHSSETEGVVVPYLFYAGNNANKGVSIVDVDLRAMDSHLWNTVLRPRLTQILQTINSSIDDWLLEEREAALKRIPKKLDEEDSVYSTYLLTTHLNNEYVARLLKLIESDPQLSSSGLGGVAKGIIVQWHAIKSAELEISQSLLPQHLKMASESLSSSHRVLSLDSHWLQEQLKLEELKFLNSSRFLAHDIASRVCKEYGDRQGAYFLNRDKVFLENTHPVLAKELAASLHVPNQEYHWILNIPFRKQPLPIITSSSYPCYRFVNFFYRSLVIFLNLLILSATLVVAAPELLYKKQLSLSEHYQKIPTLRKTISYIDLKFNRRKSMLSTRYNQVVKKPNLNRRNHWSKHRVIFGVLNGAEKACKCVITFVTILVYPLVTLAIIIGAILLGLTCIITAPIASVLFYAYCIFVVDIDNSRESLPLFKILLDLIYHITKAFAYATTAIVFCPGAFLILIAASSLRYICRHFYDLFTYHVIIRRISSLPSWAVTPVNMTPVQKKAQVLNLSESVALLILYRKLEAMETGLLYEKMAETLRRPLEEFETFFHQYLEPFGCRLISSDIDNANRVKNGATSGPYYPWLIGHLGALNQVLTQNLLTLRPTQTYAKFTQSLYNNCRIYNYDSFCKKGVAMLKNIFSGQIARINLNDESSSGFWMGRSLEMGQWQGLFLQVVTEVFGAEVMFSQETMPDHQISPSLRDVPALSRKSSHLPRSRQSELDNDSENLVTLHDLIKGFENISIYKRMKLTLSNAKLTPPYLCAEDLETSRSRVLELMAHPPLHPAVISMLIHNRDNVGSDSVGFVDVENCHVTRAVIRALQDHQQIPFSCIQVPDRAYSYSQYSSSESSNSETEDLERSTECTRNSEDMLDGDDDKSLEIINMVFGTSV